MNLYAVFANISKHTKSSSLTDSAKTSETKALLVKIPNARRYHPI